jgi:hypothetical protein
MLLSHSMSQHLKSNLHLLLSPTNCVHPAKRRLFVRFFVALPCTVCTLFGLFLAHNILPRSHFPHH